MMAEEKWEEIELVKDENGIVPHEALIIALHYHWQEVGCEEGTHGLIDRLHTHGALDHFQECFPGGGDPVLSNGQLVKKVEEIIDCLKQISLSRQEASKRFMELSRLYSNSLDNNEEKLSYELQDMVAFVAHLPEFRRRAESKLLELNGFGSVDNFGKGLKEKVKNPAVAKAC